MSLAGHWPVSGVPRIVVEISPSHTQSQDRVHRWRVISQREVGNSNREWCWPSDNWWLVLDVGKVESELGCLGIPSHFLLGHKLRPGRRPGLFTNRRLEGHPGRSFHPCSRGTTDLSGKSSSGLSFSISVLRRCLPKLDACCSPSNPILPPEWPACYKSPMMAVTLPLPAKSTSG